MLSPRTPAPEVAHARAKVASLSAHNPDPELLAEARADLAEAKRIATIERLVAQAPPLTAGQRARLAALLNGT